MSTYRRSSRYLIPGFWVNRNKGKHLIESIKTTSMEDKDKLEWSLEMSMLYSWHSYAYTVLHDDVIKWKHFPRYWPFVWGIHRSPVNSPHKGQWRGALMFSLICAWIKDWVNNREAGDLRRHRAHYDVIVMRYIIVYITIILTFVMTMQHKMT